MEVTFPDRFWRHRWLGTFGPARSLGSPDRPRGQRRRRILVCFSKSNERRANCYSKSNSRWSLKVSAKVRVKGKYYYFSITWVYSSRWKSDLARWLLS